MTRGAYEKRKCQRRHRAWERRRWDPVRRRIAELARIIEAKRAEIKMQQPNSQMWTLDAPRRRRSIVARHALALRFVVSR